MLFLLVYLMRRARMLGTIWKAVSNIFYRKLSLASRYYILKRIYKFYNPHSPNKVSSELMPDDFEDNLSSKLSLELFFRYG